ncbi:hypothetical protein ACM6RM_27910, partial [Streptomyces pratensis]
RAEPPTPTRRTRHSVRTGAEGTINEFTHAHGRLRCRYREKGKARIQHDLAVPSAPLSLNWPSE